MAKVISLFSHKGKVSKTTTTFNLGWMFAEMGLKTLIVDADPQCNLTSYVLGLDSQKEMDLFYAKKENDDVYNAIKHILKPSVNDIAGVKAVKPTDTLHKNLKLAAGNIAINELDVFCTVGITSDNKYNIHALKFVGLFNSMIRETARLYEFDIVLVDMSPGSGAFNRSILMGSDYFIIPTYPDFFCYQSIEYLASQLPEWSKEFERYRKPEVLNALPKHNPKMLGVICQRYRPFKNTTQDKVKEAQKWVDKIQSASNNILSQPLKEVNMIIDEVVFKSFIHNEKPYNLVNIPDFNSLILLSQEYNVPVFSLTKEQLNQNGVVLEKWQDNQKVFQSLFESLALSITQMIGLEIADKSIFDSLINKASKPV